MRAAAERIVSPYGSRRLDAIVVVGLLLSDAVGIVVDVAQHHLDSGARVAGLGVVALVVAASFFLRRRRPLVVAAVMVAGFIAAGAIHKPALVTQRTGAQVVLVVFAVASWCVHRRRSIALGVGLGALATLIGATVPDATAVTMVSLPAALVGAPWFAGRNARARRRHLAGIEAQLAATEADREARARRAVAEERARIARELHDVVAHHVSLIGLQAGAARSTLDEEAHADAARQAFSGIESSSREVLREMRQLLDVLDDGSGAALVAPPGPDEFVALCRGYGAAGLTVNAPDVAAVGSLAPLVALTLYRIIEEALTNVTRHSAARTCSVELAIDERAAHLRVVDPGPAARPTDNEPAGGRRGITGMRERVKLFDGTFECGPTSDGGFAVRATLPLVDGDARGAVL